MKNMNSFRSIVRAIKYEAERQVEVIENGGTITQETLRWDDISGKTFPMRDKEDAQDYRYFPDPDLVAIKLSDEYIENIRKNLPELPEVKKERYLKEYELSEKAANFVTSSKYYSDIFDEATEKSKTLTEALQSFYPYLKEGNYKSEGMLALLARFEEELPPRRITAILDSLHSIEFWLEGGTITISAAFTEGLKLGDFTINQVVNLSSGLKKKNLTLKEQITKRLLKTNVVVL